MDIKIKNGSMEHNEVSYYVNHIRKNNPGMEIQDITLTICEDGYVDAHYTLEPVPFERIRRITGYLVGTVDRFNNAKRAEVEDRVKHMSVSA